VANKQQDTGVKVAKITAMQAILVALITSVASLTAGFLVAKKSSDIPASAVTQRWLVIERVEGDSTRHVRIVAHVNGANFSYPSKAVWSEIGPQMSRERFPLPLESSTYRVSFSAFNKLPPPGAPIEETTSQQAEEIKVSLLPVSSKSYELYPLAGGYRGATPGFRVIWSIE
jgi:hypothetical protein